MHVPLTTGEVHVYFLFIDESQVMQSELVEPTHAKQVESQPNI
jgi:hypothetical protein